MLVRNRKAYGAEDPVEAAAADFDGTIEGVVDRVVVIAVAATHVVGARQPVQPISSLKAEDEVGQRGGEGCPAGDWPGPTVSGPAVPTIVAPVTGDETTLNCRVIS